MNAMAGLDSVAPARPAADAPAPGWTETTRIWGEPGQRCVGVLSQPAGGVQASGIGVIVIVGGPQTRIGAHRQFVQTARRLAAAGHTVLRFDLPGRGDSEGHFPGFEALTPAVLAASDELRRAEPTLNRLVLWGLCDGAAAALLVLDECQRAGRGGAFAGLMLLNPWVRSAQTEAAAQVKHHYAARLRDPDFWRRVLRGEVGLAAVGDAARAVWRMVAGSRDTAAGSRGGDAALPFPQRMARAWKAHRGALLLVQSGEDFTAREFDEALSHQAAWRGAAAHPSLKRVDVAGADHTFSHAAHRRTAEDAMLAWLDGLAADPR